MSAYVLVLAGGTRCLAKGKVQNEGSSGYVDENKERRVSDCTVGIGCRRWVHGTGKSAK
jgi:hypothetical protein